MEIDIEINNELLTKVQRDSINETVSGLNFIALNLEKNQLNQLSRLIRAVMVDIVSWSKNSFMVNNELNSENCFNEYLIDTSMLAAMEFLAKFALLDDNKIKDEVLEAVLKLEDIINSNKHYN